MKIYVFVLTVVVAFTACSPHEIDLKGPYFGQEPPGLEAKLFAPGLISTGANEMNICFSAKGDEMFLFITGPNYNPRIILTSKMENEVWADLTEVPFHDKDRTDAYPFLTPDGKKLFFNSSRPYEGMEVVSEHHRNHEIWFIEKNTYGWEEPERINIGDDFEGNVTYPSVALNGNMYFNGGAQPGNSDIYYAEYKDGKYLTPLRLNDSVNSNAGDFHPYIAPDESYLLFDSQRQEDTFGQQDIYISFRDDSGEWEKAINIGESVNSQSWELRPYVTFDGKYLFFISNRSFKTDIPDTVLTRNQMEAFINCPGNGSQDIYWIDAGFINELKSK